MRGRLFTHIVSRETNFIIGEWIFSGESPNIIGNEKLTFLRLQGNNYVIKPSSFFQAFLCHRTQNGDFLGSDEVRAPIERVTSLAKILAIANQKGGVGKTTTSVNLAACLGAKKQRVLLVDSDPQGNASSGFGIQKSELPATIYDVLLGNASAAEATVHTDYKVDVVPANINLAGAEVELVSAISRETRLKKALDAVRDAYDYILIDCPPSLGLLTLNALAAADAVLLPIQCEYYALEGVAQLMNTITLVRDNLNPDLAVEGVVLTMYDGRTKLAQDVVSEVQKNFGDIVYKTLIPRNVRLSEAPSYGQPVIYYDKHSKGAKVYQELAKEVLKRGR